MTQKTHHNKIRASKIFTGLAVLGMVGASAVVHAQQQPQQQGAQAQQGGDQQVVQQRLAEIQNKLQRLNLEIEQVRSEATEDPAVTKALLDYNGALTKEMKQIDPQQADKIDRRAELFEEVIDFSASDEMTQEDVAEVQALHGEFAQVREELRLVESQANQQDAVLQALDAYNTNIVREMTKIDPEIESKLTERDELRNQFTQMQRAIAQ